MTTSANTAAGRHLRSLVIHGHFYQPPRDNPWLDEVEIEPSAAPFHDWNQRIERECYRAVVAARIQGTDGRIAAMMNTLEWISFNFGPTLLEWMERAAPDTYEAIRRADVASARRLGFGNAMAQPYHHAILPLATRRDKVTEVRWGIADFRRRFQRDPVGMWLPETALDDETLDVLAEHGIQFTIVAPYQVREAPPLGLPGRYRTSHGRTIALFPYNGEMAHGIAFGGALNDALQWVRMIRQYADNLEHPAEDEEAKAGDTKASGPALPDVSLLSAATDGESYGHHHQFGEMALARMLQEIRPSMLVENFASFLARHPAEHDVALVEPSAWSCAHGVERWRSNCGCRIDGVRNPSQEWRTPLRDGLNALAGGLHAIYEREVSDVFTNPWKIRDDYGEIVADARRSGVDAFLDARTSRTLVAEERVRVRELLEMERDALRMFTSCAWFFDDIGGIEARQVLRYAGHAIALAGKEAAPLEAALIETLALAQSNDRVVGTGRDVYLMSVRSRATAANIAAAELAAHMLGVHHEIDYAAATVVTHRDRVTVTERRTGRVQRYRGRVWRVGAGDVEIELSDDAAGATPRVFTVRDLPESARMEIRSMLRRQLLPRCLTAVEMDHLAAGDVQLRGIVAVALQREITRLGLPDIEEVLPLVDALLDLFDQLELKVPFDAQTTFWQVDVAASKERRQRLSALRWRLGFEGEPPTEGPTT